MKCSWQYQLWPHLLENFFRYFNKFPSWHCCLFCLGADGVWFSLNGTTYENNSLVTLEDIGEGVTSLLCVTSLTACCRHLYAGRYPTGNWYFPNKTRVHFYSIGSHIYRSRGHMVVCLHHRRGGVNGIYWCVIPDSLNVMQTIYIGVYTANTGKYSLKLKPLFKEEEVINPFLFGGGLSLKLW